MARLLAALRRIRNWAWGYDYFISYHWRSGGKYAIALSQILADRKFDCFLDRSEFAAGDDWKAEASRALANTQRLIVIATREALIESDAVAHEVNVFANRSDHIIPIGFGEELTEEEQQRSHVLDRITGSVLQLQDSRAALRAGNPSLDEVILELENSDKLLRRRLLRLRIVSTVVTVLAAAVVIVSILALAANQARKSEREAALNAQERAREARIAEVRAVATQSFAELLRVSERAHSLPADSDEKRALEAIAPKYGNQSRDGLERATDLSEQLDQWRVDNDRVAYAGHQALSVEVIPTKFTGAILLHAGSPARPDLILIDGGDRRGYLESVKPTLERLRQIRSPHEPMALNLVVSSQVDNQQIAGLTSMTTELAEFANAGSGEPWLQIENLWSNIILPAEYRNISGATRDRKLDLVIAARDLNLSVNEPFDQWVAVPEAGAARILWSNDLDLTILGPKLKSMQIFADFWVRHIASRADNTSIVFEAPDVVETFTDERIELLPSPILPIDFSGVRSNDRSAANLASIVMMLESAGKRVLLTSDATDEILLNALAQAGYMDANGHCEVDVLFLPHDGSDRNVSPEFFSSVFARHYVALGDGGHGNPELQTFRWLLEARRHSDEPFTIYLSRHPAEFRNRTEAYPVDALLQLFQSERSLGTRFRVLHPRAGALSFAFHLLQPPLGTPDTLVELRL